MNDLKKRDFEACIEHWLIMEGGYTNGNQATCDKDRAHSDKIDTYVLDFVNAPENIKKSLEPFYTGSELIKTKPHERID